MSLKRIEMDWMFEIDYYIFTKACELALQHQCDDVVFEFNGGKFSVSRSSIWNEEVSEKLITFPRQQNEIKL